MTKRSNQVGFTLIELLVVIAIIALLASLLLPTLARATEQGRTAKCTSNVKQITLGILLYVSDHDTYPSAVNDSLAGYLPSWFRRVQPYLGHWTNENTVLRCPSLKLPNDGANPSYPVVSYGYNTGGGSGHGLSPPFVVGGAQLPGIGETEVRVPARMIAVADSYIVDMQPAGILSGLPELQYQPLSQRKGLPFFAREQKVINARHGGRVQVGFCDGHVERIKHTTLYADDMESRRIWSRSHEPFRVGGE